MAHTDDGIFVPPFDEPRTAEDRLDDIESTLIDIRNASGRGGGYFADLAAIVWSIIAGIWLYRHW